MKLIIETKSKKKKERAVTCKERYLKEKEVVNLTLVGTIIYAMLFCGAIIVATFNFAVGLLGVVISSVLFIAYLILHLTIKTAMNIYEMLHEKGGK